ncbi:MAG TPA: hypothetical protein VIL09_05270 [Microvirga sp.]
MAEASNFELVVLLIISETTQQAMIDSDHSMTNAALVIITLLSISVALALLKERYSMVDRVLGGTPLCWSRMGMCSGIRLKAARIGTDEILQTARKDHGLERLEQVKYAILGAGEASPSSLMPRREADPELS